MSSLPSDIKQQAEKCFEKYDVNKNNSIGADELKSLMFDVLDEIAIPRPSEEDLKGIMEDTDENKDKSISREEFFELFKVIYMMKTSG